MDFCYNSELLNIFKFNGDLTEFILLDEWLRIKVASLKKYIYIKFLYTLMPVRTNKISVRSKSILCLQVKILFDIFMLQNDKGPPSCKSILSNSITN